MGFSHARHSQHARAYAEILPLLSFFTFPDISQSLKSGFRKKRGLLEKSVHALAYCEFSAAAPGQKPLRLPRARSPGMSVFNKNSTLKQVSVSRKIFGSNVIG